MSASSPSTPAPAFVTQLRIQKVIELVPQGTPGSLFIRVEMPEIWDTIGIVAMATEPVVSVKVRALEQQFPQADFHEDFVMKLRGWDVLDENATLADAGATDGSIFLITHRRRRPVR